MRRRGNSVAANPILIGAATVLVVIVAVFLAYNANNGLPFVPTYELKAQVANAASLVDGNEVRIGGDRVGFISAIVPVTHKDGSVSAELTLKLDTNVKPLPDDSTLIVRPRSAISLKYLEITRGHSRQGFKNGATIPLRQATPAPVEIDQVFNMFDKKTRDAQKVNLREFGNALAGRGKDINSAILDFDPLLRNLTPVMRNLADPNTGLGRFFPALERTAAIVAPVAETQAALFGNLATTFDAFAAIARPYLQDTISGGPAALDTATRVFPYQRTFLANSTAFFRELRPGVAALKTSSPLLADAFTAGTKTLRQSPALNQRVGDAFASLESFANDPQVPLGIDGLTGTAQALAPTIANLAGAQIRCNYLAIVLNNAASALSDGDTANQGNWARITAVPGPIGVNGEAGPAAAPGNGAAVGKNGDPGTNHLHANAYPLVGGYGQPDACVAGNERYVPGQAVIGNPPGQHPTKTTKVPKDLNGDPNPTPAG
ncbi:MAG: Mammalian cell entry related domain protein [Conexibacter sp.]|nr:Mammalian cell entry related domain protein [Conexibacter sp.]